MKKKIIVLALCVLLISGCGSKIPKLSNGDEAVITMKDGQKISVNELYDKMKSNYALDSLLELVDKKILDEKYGDRVDEANQSAESTINTLEQYYGDNLDGYLQSQGFGSLDDAKAYLYLNYMRNLAVEDYCKDQIKDKEIKEYYENEIRPDIVVSHILITPNVTDDMTDEEKEAAEKEAEEKINSVIAELKKTNSKDVAAKFAELAKQYSMDETNKDNGGSLGTINTDTLSEEYDELVDAAYKLKDGEYSKSLIKTEIGYHVILRTETKEKASLDEVKDTILTNLASEYIKTHQVAQVEALQQLRKNNKVEIVDSDLQAKYATYIQEQLTYYQNADKETAEGDDSEE